jgi:hypothetical protein
MNTISIRKKLVTAAMGTAVTAAALPALALTNAPAAQAACDKWGFTWDFITWSQTNSTTGEINFPRPAPSDPPVFESFSGTYAWAQFRDNPKITGKATGSVSGDNIKFWVLWDDGAKGDYRGTIDQNGIASGTTSGAGQTANWRFNKPLGRCATPPPPDPPPPPPPVGPPKKIIYTTPPGVDIDNVFGFDPGVVVTVTNPRTIDTHCKYEAVPRPPTALQNSVREFDMKAKGTANFKINGLPTGTTWDVTVSCPNQVPANLTHQF